MARSMHNGTDTCVVLSAAITSYSDVSTVTMSGMSISLSFCARSPCESNCSSAVERLNMSTETAREEHVYVRTCAYSFTRESFISGISVPSVSRGTSGNGNRTGKKLSRVANVINARRMC